MDDTEDDARYPPNPYHQHRYGSLNRQKLPVQSASYSRPVSNQYIVDDIDDDDDDDDDDDFEEKEQFGEGEDDDADQTNDFQLLHKDARNGDDNDESNGDDDDDESNDDDDDNEDIDKDHDNDKQKIYTRIMGDVETEHHPKKRKLKSLISNYEIVPRVPASSAAPSSALKPSFGGRNALTDWTEDDTFALLDAWGDLFLQHGRKSLRSEEWQEVAEKVSEVSKIERTDTQCRNRVDTLKKKYKKEKMKLAEVGGGTSKWVYFKKMDRLMSSPPQQAGLSCGLDSGKYIFKNPRVYLNRVNGLDEMRDSPGSSEATNEEDGSDELPPKKRKHGRDNDEGSSSFRLIADSIKKFSEIYEKIESNKRQQMVELERMRMDFHRDLESQKRQILERAQAEIAKIRQGEEEDNNDSADNAST